MLASVLFISSALTGVNVDQSAPLTPVMNVDYTLNEQAKPAGGDRPIDIAPATEGGSEITISAAQTFKTGRPFRKQGFNLTTHATSETSATAKIGGFTATIWHAETGHHADFETDAIASYEIDVGNNFSVNLQAAYYALPGKHADALQQMVTVSKKLSDQCSVGVSLEKIEHGFKETTESLQTSCGGVSLGHGLTAGATVMVAHSAFSGLVTGSVDANVSKSLTKKLDFHVGFEFFANSRENALVPEFGFSLQF